MDITPEEAKARTHAHYIQRIALLIHTYEAIDKAPEHIAPLRDELAAALQAGTVTLYDETGAEVA